MFPLLIIFISLSAALGHASNSQLDLLTIHFLELIDEGDEVVLCFNGDISSFKNHNNGHFIQQIVLRTNYSEQLGYRFNRLIIPVNIIFTAYNPTEQGSFYTIFRNIMNVLMATDTIVHSSIH